MTRLATLEDFFASRGEAPLVEQDHENVMRATLALDQASEVVRGYTRRTFDATTDTVAVDGTGTTYLLLPDPPITEVFTVTELDYDDEETAIEATDYRVSAGAGLLFRKDGARWCRGMRNYRVEMVHGFVLPDDDLDSGDGEPLPSDIQMVTISVASRHYELGQDGTSTVTGEGRTAIQIGTYREEFASGGTTTTVTRGTAGLTEVEAGVLDRYRLARIG